ncbi:TetR family transcriptional regulator [Streptomyces hokutonensis]|uniref:TetR family transcriptional regulator n=1 Tax=Streptomyces hokutonensis TaxID=1306990 RepID=UPI000380F85F|nr:TetR family transcriptional regulator [Streptomyces hokutonensis]
MPRSLDHGRTTGPTGASDGGESTRERIIAAAMEEFALHGIAGARVDRIAKLARTSKDRVYTYFRGKEALYAHISERELAVIAEATQMDPTDLPGYAGRLFDYFVARPDHHRLISWGRLELSGPRTVADDPTRATISRKLEQLRRAQEAGQLDSAWDPVDILALVNQIAMTWASQPEFTEAAAEHARDPSLTARRAAVVAAVASLFPRAD